MWSVDPPLALVTITWCNVLSWCWQPVVLTLLPKLLTIVITLPQQQTRYDDI